jgi:DNA polymerase-3 subunit epsilon
MLKLLDQIRKRMSSGKPELPPDVTEDMVDSLREKILSHEPLTLTGQPLAAVRYAVFDTETTGYYPFAGDEIIALSAVTTDGKTMDREPYFDRLVNPYREIPSTITELTAITRQQTDQAASLLYLMPEFLDFVGDRVLVAHPAAFDLNFINLKLRRCCQCKLRHHVIDMMQVAYHLFPAWPNHSLERLADYYKIPLCNRHRSLADAQLTAHIWHRFLQELDARGIHTLYALQVYLNRLR